MPKYLVTLAKFALISLTGAIPSCYNDNHRDLVDTEIFCPQRSVRFLLLYTSKKDTIEAVEKTIKERSISGDNSKNAILRFSKGRSTMVENVAPEELRSCYFTEYKSRDTK